MNLVIKSKERNKNDRRNKNLVTFEIDGIEKKINIIYLTIHHKIEQYKCENARFNAFLCDDLYEDVEKYVLNKYNCTWKEFGDYFMYKLYKYSRGINLSKECINNDDQFIKRMEVL